MESIIKWITSSAGIITLIVAAISIGLYIAFKISVKKFVKKNNNATTFLIGAVKYIILAIGIIVILDVNGINISRAFAGLGIASIIIGFALQDALKDTIMGTHIIVDNFFKVGDVVQFENFEGVVISFTMRTTKLKSIATNELYSISNRDIEKIIRSSGICDIMVPMPYEEDPEEMHQLMTHICEEFEKVEHVIMGEFMGTQNFNDSSITYNCRFRCNPVYKPQTRRNCLFVVQRCLKEAGKAIPYNQLDIHQKD